ncbi:MAG TPA: FxsA family protein [Campylobacterales bacterium]|nr:FxsA family protein [Campylobacterales bacterium]
MIYFLIYLFLEITLSVEIASKIGGLYTFLEVIFSAFFGLFLLTNFKYTLGSNMAMIFSGEMDIKEFQRLSLFAILGAFLLIVPGFFSDILGVLLQFSAFGTFFARKFLKLKPKNKNKNNNDRGDMDSEIIDVEVIDYRDIRK